MVQSVSIAIHPGFLGKKNELGLSFIFNICDVPAKNQYIDLRELMKIRRINL